MSQLSDKESIKELQATVKMLTDNQKVIATTAYNRGFDAGKKKGMVIVMSQCEKQQREELIERKAIEKLNNL